MARGSLFRMLAKSLARSDDPNVADNLRQGESQRPQLWKHSDQYETAVAEGHRQPPPWFGSPTLVWHLGIWERTSIDARRGPSAGTNSTPFDSLAPGIATVAQMIDDRNEKFFSEISRFLRSLQERGRIHGAPLVDLTFVPFDSQTVSEAANDSQNNPYSFKICRPQSISFNIWWQDKAGAGQVNERQTQPAPSDIRVRVQAQTHLEHATISFFVDVGKPWNAEAVFRSDHAVGVRRRTIFQYIESVRSISEEQIRRGCVDFDSEPERLSSAKDAGGLLEGARYIYESVWDEFLSAFEIPLSEDTPGNDSAFEGELFADLRGAVISVEGMTTPYERRRQQGARKLREALADSPPLPSHPGSDATIGIGRFRKFDETSGEPNTILKSFWPFMRRVTPNADRRDFVGCGILDWRCLYLSALGSPAESFHREESTGSDTETPFGRLPNQQGFVKRHAEPIRFLLLTKGEPHRRQIGRFVERICAIETMRLFALKHWPTIWNAGVHIRVIGRELDGVLSRWSKRRAEIDREFGEFSDDTLLRAASEDSSSANERNWVFQYRGRKRSRVGKKQRVPHGHSQGRMDDRLVSLNRLISKTESKLIELGAHLDNIGRRGAGRLLYAIDRSKFFIDEFERMVPTLEIGNIDGWINYEQFVNRGMRPTFDLIKGVRINHTLLRDRLQAITEMIQTSALIVESEATSSNTKVLRQIASNWNFSKWGIGIGAFGIVVELIANHWEVVVMLFNRIAKSLLSFLG